VPDCRRPAGAEASSSRRHWSARSGTRTAPFRSR
jgi:hypothetical protein